jgi:hypothetical protein
MCGASPNSKCLQPVLQVSEVWKPKLLVMAMRILACPMKRMANSMRKFMTAYGIATGVNTDCHLLVRLLIDLTCLVDNNRGSMKVKCHD